VALGCSQALLIERRCRAHQPVTRTVSAEAGATSPWQGEHPHTGFLASPRMMHICGIISKIKVLHLKIKVYMKNVAVFTH